MNGGWWLKISTVEEFKNYLIATDSRWCRKKELIFPNFKKDDLKIERFPMGKHW